MVDVHIVLTICLSLCTAKTCLAKNAIPSNARASITTETPPSVVNITCIEGYQLSNTSLNSRMCVNGTWSDHSAQFCERIRCPYLINLPPGSMFANGATPLDSQFETKLAVTCKKGFTKISGSGYVQCNSQGKWHWISGPVACDRITCPDPRLRSKDKVHGEKDAKAHNYQINSTVSFSCEQGMQLVGEASLTCRDNGTWSSPAPECKCRLLWDCRNAVVMLR